MTLPKLFFSPCQEPPYRISGSTRQFHQKGCLYGAHILDNGRCRSYTSTFHKSFPAQRAVAYLNDILSRETAWFIGTKSFVPDSQYGHLIELTFHPLGTWKPVGTEPLGNQVPMAEIIWLLVANQTDIAFSDIKAVYHSRQIQNDIGRV